jgi:GNAT superfamily N-acetyltransferase
MFFLYNLKNCGSSFIYKSLTFPIYHNLLETLSTRENIIAIGASVNRKPIGLILAEISKNKSAEILSIYVKPTFRRQGIGTALLANLEKKLRLIVCPLVEIVYIAGSQNPHPLECLLQKFNWAKPDPRMLVCKTNIYLVADAPWMKLSRLPSAYEIFPWTKITAQERIALQKNQKEKSWIAKDADPFQHESNLEPLNSLGLRYKGQVAGWMICHRLNRDTIRYTCGYVRPDLQKMGRFIPLLIQAIKLQTEARIPRGTWTTALFHASFADFVQKHMKPYLESLEQSKGAYKYTSNQ